MDRPLELLLYFLLHLLTGAGSLVWKEGAETAAPLIKCRGQNVTFPWQYSLEEGDNLMGISWSHRTPQTDKATSLGTYVQKVFYPSSNRISQVEIAGIKVSNIQPSDSGTYIVNVRLGGHGGLHTRNVSLQVAEFPKTKNGRLQGVVNELPISMTTQSQPGMVNGNGNDCLMCGQFTDLGIPPVSVIWMDPDGQVLPSTRYEQGYFMLDLTEDSKGGKYSCMLNRSSAAVGCLPRESQLLQSAEVMFSRPRPPPSDTTTPHHKAASMSPGAVVGIVIAVVVIIAIVIIVSVFIIRHNRKGKSYAPKEPDSPGPDEDATQPFKDA